MYEPGQHEQGFGHPGSRTRQDIRIDRMHVALNDGVDSLPARSMSDRVRQSRSGIVQHDSFRIYDHFGIVDDDFFFIDLRPTFEIGSNIDPAGPLDQFVHKLAAPDRPARRKFNVDPFLFRFAQIGQRNIYRF